MCGISLTLKHVFRKTKTSFKKLENRFLVARTTIKNATIVAKSHRLGVRLTYFYKILCLTSEIRIPPKSHGHLIQHEKIEKTYFKTKFSSLHK